MDNSSDQQNILNEFDKRVILRYKRVKNKNKTYVYGIDKLLVEKDKLEDFLKKIKKKLGCGGILGVDEEKNNYVEFMGDHRDKIKNILVEEKIITEDKIEMKGA
jgi:translation initiation factor 1 (eIF-1/SUI1)